MMIVKRDRARLKKLGDEDDDYVDASPAERVNMIWELTAKLWSLGEKVCARQPLKRHIARLILPKQKSNGVNQKQE